ncbi:MAG: hypothetical protein WKG06_22190 [Segetibacter sp.]
MNLAGCFIKFGEFQHMSDLQQGLLYCKSINYFTEIEDNSLRGDDLENVVEMIYIESGEVLLGKPEEIPIKDGIRHSKTCVAVFERSLRSPVAMTKPCGLSFGSS